MSDYAQKIPNEITQEELMIKVLDKVAIPSDGNVHITITNQTQNIPTPYNHKGISHRLQSVTAMVELLTKHGSAEKSIVYFNKENINAILDQTITNRPLDTAVYEFLASHVANVWKNIFNCELGQKAFIKFLKSREQGEIPGMENLISSAQKITANFKIISESSYVDSNNMGIVYKIEDMNGKTTDEGKMIIPEEIAIWMPLLLETSKEFRVVIDLELTKPVDGKAPFFKFSCPRWNIYWENAVAAAVEDLRNRLPGYLIISGEGFVPNQKS